MARRWVDVSATATLLILAFFGAAAARISNKAIVEKGSASRIVKSDRPNGASTSAARGRQSCTPCKAESAKRKKGGLRNNGLRARKESPCHPKNYLDPNIALSYKTALRDMKREGIKPEITSTWRSSADQAQLRRCSMSTHCRRMNPGLYHALPPGTSMHEAGFAIDMSGIAAGPRGGKRITSKGKRIVSIMRKNGFTWRYGLSDPAHFEADPRKHGYRTLKQAIKRTQTTCQVALAKARAQKKRENKAATNLPQSSPKARTLGETTATQSRQPARKVGP